MSFLNHFAARLVLGCWFLCWIRPSQGRSFVGGCYPHPGDQRFGWSDCTLAGSGEGRCDREGAAADLVVGVLVLAEFPTPGIHRSKKGYDDACDMRDLGMGQN